MSFPTPARNSKTSMMSQAQSSMMFHGCIHEKHVSCRAGWSQCQSSLLHASWVIETLNAFLSLYWNSCMISDQWRSMNPSMRHSLIWSQKTALTVVLRTVRYNQYFQSCCFDCFKHPQPETSKNLRFPQPRFFANNFFCRAFRAAIFAARSCRSSRGKTDPKEYS